MEPQLHHELQYYVDSTTFGPFIRHPILFHPLIDVMIPSINDIFEQKQAQVERAIADDNWNLFIWLHERPHRLDAFERVAGHLDDEEYWRLLGAIWIDTEFPSQRLDDWNVALSSERPFRHAMMSDENYSALLKMPSPITVYRGYAGVANYHGGLSWSLSYDKAKWFAKRFAIEGESIRLLKGQVDNKDVIAYFTERGEDEIVSQHVNIQEIIIL